MRRIVLSLILMAIILPVLPVYVHAQGDCGLPTRLKARTVGRMRGSDSRIHSAGQMLRDAQS